MLLTCSYGIYYFIALIIQYYLLLPVLQKYYKTMMPLSVIASLGSIILITIVTKFYGIGLPLIVYAGPFPVWIVFFMIGVYYSLSDKSPSLKLSLTLVFFGLVLSYAETYWLNTTFGGGYGIKLSAFIYSIGAVCLSLSPKIKELYKSNIATNLIANIGRISFGIYLIHIFVISAVRNIMHIYSWSLLWLTTILISCAIILIAKQVLPEKFNYYLGFNQ